MATFKRYRDDHGNSITKIHSKNPIYIACKNELLLLAKKIVYIYEPAEEFKTALRTAIRCIYNHRKLYEKILPNSIRKFGTDEKKLTRVIVTREEKNLNDIKELYYKRNSVPLDQAVAKDTSGHHKAFLLSLLGKED
ncbi:hypothetical protein SADUNF_Sadunf01G0021700 [Salix dunnii]|uniref:Annexin n=1 Tax=Salix dunnii TaxID=1413687 RepID=A0A835N9I7_9ROSI|nr:hypothetical protein SADUNF_Sadunf01G0021700 [Salix dunnii]